MHCINHEHAIGIERYTLDILEAIETVSKDTLPVRGGSCKSRFIKRLTLSTVVVFYAYDFNLAISLIQ